MQRFSSLFEGDIETHDEILRELFMATTQDGDDALYAKISERKEGNKQFALVFGEYHDEGGTIDGYIDKVLSSTLDRRFRE